jgi:dolichol-phosphate mannosyltransferase
VQIEPGPGVIPPKISVVIPAFKVSKHILGLLAKIGPEVGAIYVVDDGRPEKTGELVVKNCTDSRVHVIYHPENRGVGGAVMTGYRTALRDGVEIIVKLDGDGQMNPSLIPRIVRSIQQEQADYTEGNRFFNVEYIREMPLLRILGNLALSFFSKLSSGYWHIFDPNNGFTAINAKAAAQLPLNKISSRYFFESDMLFRLNLMRAVVVDVPMDAFYGDETSNLRLRLSVFEFGGKHIRNAFNRILYTGVY